MAIYITDDKKETVRQYSTSAKVEKAIETLLKETEGAVGSETKPGYTVLVVEKQ